MTLSSPNIPIHQPHATGTPKDNRLMAYGPPPASQSPNQAIYPSFKAANPTIELSG